MDMTDMKREAAIVSQLTIHPYRSALASALEMAGREPRITCEGAKVGFDALVLDSMEPAAFAVEVTDKAVLVRAGHYLALEAAVKKILEGKGLDGVSFTGSYEGEIPLTRGDMVLVWNEEFDGDRLDPSKWAFRAKMSQGDILNSTDERNVTVTGGELLLRSWKEENSERPYSTNTSVTTDGTFSYKYGYLEMYANVPYVAGAWPSFWLLGSDIHKTSDYRAEVDVIEVFGSSREVYSEIHKSTVKPSGWINYACPDSEEDRGYRFSDSAVPTLNREYHRYGFGWTPAEMYFTLDGEVYWTHAITEEGNFGDGDMACFHDPLYIIFNNFLFTEGSSWKPSPVTPQTVYPLEYRIDWVRLYQTPGEGERHYDFLNG